MVNMVFRPRKYNVCKPYIYGLAFLTRKPRFVNGFLPLTEALFLVVGIINSTFAKVKPPHLFIPQARGVKPPQAQH